jgi:hypothetical protein
MPRPVPEPIEAGGQDSFVDVVTNLVGILIVLVLIVSVRVKHGWLAKVQSPDGAPPPAVAASADDNKKSLSTLAATAGGLEQDVHQIAAEMESVDQEMAVRAGEREKIATLVSAAEHVVAEHREKLAAGAREEYDLRRQADALNNELAGARQELSRAEHAQPAAVEVKHYMTPISRTVFGKEVHFRLEGGRVAYVPIDELFERAKSQIQRELPDMSNPRAITEQKHTVGPYGGFEMQFTIGLDSDGRGRYTLHSKEWQVVPVAGEVGEKVADALRPGSELRRQLALLEPSQTTITVWLYPDSFREFRTLKDELYRMGFVTAARPLPPGLQVAGSEHGTRSAAQ